jgi:hypothetical protein
MDKGLHCVYKMSGNICMVGSGLSVLFTVLSYPFILQIIFCHVFCTSTAAFRNKDLYWQKIMQFHQTRAVLGDDHPNHKQLLYCITTCFLRCLHEYISTLDSGLL